MAEAEDGKALDFVVRNLDVLADSLCKDGRRGRRKDLVREWRGEPWLCRTIALAISISVGQRAFDVAVLISSRLHHSAHAGSEILTGGSFSVISGNAGHEAFLPLSYVSIFRL